MLDRVTTGAKPELVAALGSTYHTGRAPRWSGAVPWRAACHWKLAADQSS